MPIPRIHVTGALQAGAVVVLPDNAARHVQVLRLQPGDALWLFDGHGGQWQAEVLAMGRKGVSARALRHQAVERELPFEVTLAFGMPANERMDALIEKATELGVAVLQPLVTRRSVLRLEGERAERKARHWQAIALAACEQCGRNRPPRIEPAQPLSEWLAAVCAPPAAPMAPGVAAGWVLSTEAEAAPLAAAIAGLPRGAGAQGFRLLSGPEGGLEATELAAARRAGLLPTSLGPRVLRADTAPLAALALLAGWADTAGGRGS